MTPRAARLLTPCMLAGASCLAGVVAWVVVGCGCRLPVVWVHQGKGRQVAQATGVRSGTRAEARLQGFPRG